MNTLKKLLSVAVAAVCAFGAFAACDLESSESICEHDYGVWTVDKESTCTTKGQHHHTCGICYNVEYEEMDLDPDNHSYGSWQVATPTATTTGIAVKECAECGNEYTVVLPVLTDTAYTSKLVTRPTATVAGSSKYTYTNDEITEMGFEDIVFTVDIEASNIQTLGDCVELATSDESKALIYSASGKWGSKVSESAGEYTASQVASADSFSWYFYDELTYVSLNNGEEYYICAYDDEGNIFGKSNVTWTSAYIDGYRIRIDHCEPISDACGTENYLYILYTYAKYNYNNDLVETITKTYDSDGNVYAYNCEFTFGVVNEVGGGGGDYDNGVGQFSVVTVSFTMLASTFTITSLEMLCVQYLNYVADFNNCKYDSETGKWDDEAPWNYDDDGYAYVQNASGYRYYEGVVITQTYKGETDNQTQKTLSDYGLSTNYYYTDFTVKVNNTTLSWVYNETRGDYEAVDENGDAYVIELEYDTYYSTMMTITGLTPSDASNDSIRTYLRTYTNSKKTKYTETYINNTNNFNTAMAYYRSTGYVWLRWWIAGESYLVIKTAKITRVIQVYVSGGAAEGSTLFPVTYSYNEASSKYVATTASGQEGSIVTGTASVQVGGILYYKAVQVLDGVESVVVYASSCSDSNVDVVDGAVVAGLSGVSSFTATKSGTYTITITTGDGQSSTASGGEADSDVTTVSICYLKVTVTAAPTLESVLTGTYSGITDANMDIEVTFGEYTHTQIDSPQTYSNGSYTSISSLYMHTCSVYIDYNEGVRSTITLTYYSTKADGSGTVYYQDTVSSVVVYYEASSCDEMFTTEPDYDTAEELGYYFELTFTGNYSLTVYQYMLDEELYGENTTYFSVLS